MPPTIPTVKVINSIKPMNVGTGAEVLAYKNLAPAVDLYEQSNGARSNAVWDAEPGSLEELSKARQLAFEYLLRTALKTIESSPENRDVWADRFTQASSELYGTPDALEAGRLVAREYNSLLSLHGNERVSQPHLRILLDAYKPLAETVTDSIDIDATEAEASREKAAVLQYGEAIRERYQPLFDLVDMAGKDEFTAADLKDLCTAAKDWLKEHDDPQWEEWEVIFVEGTNLSVTSRDRQIKVGERREAASSKDAKGLLAHELLVHALRAKNGYKTGDKKLGSGLPEYGDAEEGLGILAEYAVTGELPDKAYDRYVDIALAMGAIDGKQKTRQRLFEISYARQFIRAQLRGESDAALATLASRVWTHVDRIYRGGPGDQEGTKQAIFTKDIAYYVGYRQMVEYIQAQYAEGKTPAQVFEFLSQGKFDPINPQHLERLEQAKAKATENKV